MTLPDLVRRAARGRARLLLAGAEPAALLPLAARLAGAGLEGVEVAGAGDFVPGRHPRQGDVAELLRRRHPDRVRDGIHALDLAGDALRFALGLLALGDADAVVAGPGISPGDLLEAALWVPGPAETHPPAGTAMWLAFEDGGLLGCADCALERAAGPEARARLALEVARRTEALTGEPPRVAFLAGPAPGPAATARETARAFEALAPGIPATLDFGLHAAGAEARFRGRPNVLIFPDSTSGHLVVRAARGLGGARLLGPVLVGPAGVVAGVPEEAEVEELTGSAALAAVLAARRAA